MCKLSVGCSILLLLINDVICGLTDKKVMADSTGGNTWSMVDTFYLIDCWADEIEADLSGTHRNRHVYTQIDFIFTYIQYKLYFKSLFLFQITVRHFIKSNNNFSLYSVILHHHWKMLFKSDLGFNGNLQNYSKKCYTTCINHIAETALNEK